MDSGFTSPQSAPRNFIAVSMWITRVSPPGLVVVISMTLLTESPLMVDTPLPVVVVPFARS